MEETGIRGETWKRTGWGKDSRVVGPRGGTPGTPRRGFVPETRRLGNVPGAGWDTLFGLSYLVDPASSHMLVSKIKPCMCKYKLILYCETANGSLNQL
jgi:hypothetical protein